MKKQKITPHMFDIDISQQIMDNERWHRQQKWEHEDFAPNPNSPKDPLKLLIILLIILLISMLIIGIQKLF